MSEISESFLLRMKSILGEEFVSFLSALDNPIEKAIYVNNNKCSVEKFKEICDFKISPIPYETNGFYVDSEKRGRHPLHHAGAIYSQEPSAMFTVNSFNFVGDEKVLDLCAAPGGKSIQIANRISRGVLVSNEFVHARSEILYSNIERMGLKNVVITSDSAENICTQYAGYFDVCLVDAPCSGEGMFRRGSEVTDVWNEGLPSMCAVRQLELLDKADKAVKTNGYIIYSTCTYSVEENENVVREFISTHDYELLTINANFDRGINMPEVVRLYPHKVKGEGQFVALMKKREHCDITPGSRLKLNDSKLARDFLKDNTNIDVKNLNIKEFKSYIYSVPNIELMSKVNYVSLGVRLGTVKKDRFEPHQYLFSAYGNEFKEKLDFALSSDEIKKFLRGETLVCNDKNGYVAVLVNGIALSGGKASGGILKNHYPKGLRNFR